MKNNYSIVTMSVSTSQFQSPASKVIIHLLITGLQKSSFHTLYTVTTILLTLHFPKDKSIHAVYFLYASYVTNYRKSHTKILLPTSCTMVLYFYTKLLHFSAVYPGYLQGVKVWSTSVTFINQLMHSIITVVVIKILLYKSLKDTH